MDIPGFKALRLEHLVLDFNGTLACDGKLLPEVAERLNHLASLLTVHVVTADTFGRVSDELEGVACRISVLGKEDQDRAKKDYVTRLGSEKTAAVGNGRNDRLMLEAASLGIAVILQEGACAQTLTAADVVCTDILTALDLFTHPLRLTATLRS